MTDQKLRRSSRELDAALTSARQTVELLRSQVQGGRVELPYFDARLGSLSKLMEELDLERRQSVQQERLAALYEVSRVIGSSLDLQTVLDQVMDAIIQLTGAERGFLMLFDDDGDLHVRVARNFDQETLSSSDSFALSRTITRRVVDSGAAVVTTNAQEDPRFAGTQSIVTHALRSIMASPLRARGQIIGVVYVDNRMRTGLFSEKDLEVLDAFAGQAAVAIDNARLFGATDKALSARVEELTLLQWIDRQLNETLDMTKTMALTLEWSMRVCKAQSASMSLLDAVTSIPQVVAHLGASDLLSEGMRIDHESPLFGMFQQVIDSQEPVFQPIVDHNNSAATAFFCVPVRRENQVIGVIVLTATDPDAFAEESRTLVERVADRAAIALENGRLYDAVRAANNAKSEFVSVVAHELKVPMTSIGGYADLLPMAGEVNERQQQFIGTIKNAVNRMKVLVSDLNDISRIESGNLRVELYDVNVQEALDAALEGTLTEIEKRGHNLMLHVPPDLPLVRADKDRLAQILLNLISNAYKYTPDGGTIRVSAERSGEAVAFSVVDSGVGMSPEQLAQLGTKFWRADNNLQQPGTGLGFAITRNLIELMHGNLTINSTPGVGSTFTFTLPVAK